MSARASRARRLAVEVVPTCRAGPREPVVALITLFTKADCHLCEDALGVLEELRIELPFELDVRDITLDDALHRRYFERIPVVCVDGEELFEYFVDAELLRERLQAGGAGGRRPPRRAP